MSRARIHFVNRFFHPDQSATSQILSGVAFDLARDGYDVHVTTSRLLYEKGGKSLPHRETVEGVTVHRVPTTGFGRAGLAGRTADYLCFYLAAAWHLLWSLRSGDVVVAKTDPPMLGLAVAPIARLKGARYVNWLQDVFPEVATAVRLGGGIGRAFFGALRRLRNWTLSAADRNVVIGGRMQRHLVEQGIARDLISVIPNWADPATIAPIDPQRSSYRRQWGLEGKLVVAYSGNLGRVHEVETIIDAIEEVQRRQAASGAQREVVFVFVGGGANRRLLKREVERRGLENVRLHPYQPMERLSEALGAADIHLVSLRPELEGLVVPSKIYGIMAAARPAIFVGARDGEVARLLADHRCGRTVQSGDWRQLADTIIELGQDDGLRRAMGVAARRAFEQAYTKRSASLSWHSMLATLQAGAPVEIPAPAPSAEALQARAWTPVEPRSIEAASQPATPTSTLRVRQRP